MSSYVRLFTDGACSGNPGPGGWAVCWQDSDGKWKRRKGKSLETTNNRMELMAFMYALAYAVQLLKSSSVRRVEICADSAYVCNAVNQGWIWKWAANGWKNKAFRQVKNADIWKRVAVVLDKAEVRESISVVKVDGHSGLEGNEVADRAAVEARDEAVVDRMLEDHGYRPPKTFKRGVRNSNNSKLV